MHSIRTSFGILLLSIVSCWTIIQSLTITQPEIENGLVIDQPGSWELVENVTFNTPYAIMVTSTGVSINLNGYTIKAVHNDQIALQIQESDCHISNGQIENSNGIGIEVINSSGVSIERMTYLNCLQAISITDSEYTNIDSCSIIHSQQTAILINNSPYTTLKNITITECSGDGVTISGTSHDSFLNQIQISDSTVIHGIKISSNTVTLKGIIAFSLIGNALVIEGNHVSAYLASIGLNNGHGCIVSGTETLLQQCSFTKNTGDGILLQITSANTNIINSSSSGNGHIGINNLGANSNQSNSTLCCNNGLRDLWRIINN